MHDAFTTRIRIAALAALAALLLAGAGDGAGAALVARLPRQSVQPRRALAPRPIAGTADRRQVAQADDAELVGAPRPRWKTQLRQLTGTIEQLQYRNQQLEMQLKRMQDDTEYRFQQLGLARADCRAAAAAARDAAAGRSTRRRPLPGRRSDAFDPDAASERARRAARRSAAKRLTSPRRQRDRGPDEPPVGAPGGRAAGAPLDLSTLAGNRAGRSRMPRLRQCSVAMPPPHACRRRAAQPRRDRRAAGDAAAVGNAAGRIRPRLRLCAAQGLRAGRSRPCATSCRNIRATGWRRMRNIWLGESLFQRQRYRDAAEAFLTVSTKYEQLRQGARRAAAARPVARRAQAEGSWPAPRSARSAANIRAPRRP